MLGVKPRAPACWVSALPPSYNRRPTVYFFHSKNIKTPNKQNRTKKPLRASTSTAELPPGQRPFSTSQHTLPQLEAPGSFPSVRPAECSGFHDLGNMRVRVLLQVEAQDFTSHHGSVFPVQSQHTAPCWKTLLRPPLHCLLIRVHMQTAWVQFPTPAWDSFPKFCNPLFLAGEEGSWKGEFVDRRKPLGQWFSTCGS